MLIVLAACILLDCAAALLVSHISSLPCTLLAHLALWLLPNTRNKNGSGLCISGFDMFSFCIPPKGVVINPVVTWGATPVLSQNVLSFAVNMTLCSPKAVCSSGPKFNRSGVAEWPLCMCETTPTALVLPVKCTLLQ